MKIKLGVIFGGNSVEHEISIISALQAIESIDKDKYSIFSIYIGKDNKWYCDETLCNIDNFKDMSFIKELNEVHLVNDNNKVNVVYKKSKLFKNNVITDIDMFFPIVHGTNVEDGKLQGYLETVGAKYCGPDVYSAVVGQDKAIMKDIFKANNISQIDYIWVTDEMDYEHISKLIKKQLKFPVILKPALLGSSVGINVVKKASELNDALEDSFKYCYKVVIEQYKKDFDEVNIAVLGNYKDISLSLIEQVGKTDTILSYDDKYKSDSSKSSGMASLDRIIPAKITKKLEKDVREIATNAFKTLNARGVCRIDLMIVDNVVYVNEINNIPGSLSFYLWEDYTTLLNKIIDLGVDKYYDDKKKEFSFDTNVLELNSKGKKS